MIKSLRTSHPPNVPPRAAPQVRLGPSFLIPNGQIGTFGAVTAFKSMVRTRTDLFDVSVAGPAAGGATALLLFAVGLGLSAGGADAQVCAASGHPGTEQRTPFSSHSGALLFWKRSGLWPSHLGPIGRLLRRIRF